MRLRVAHACRPDCALCAGPIVSDAEAAEPLLRHAEQTNRRQIYLQGSEVAAHRHLSAIVGAARRRALQVALVEDAPSADLAARAPSLRQLGIAHLYVSLPAAGPSESAAEAADPRKRALAALLALGRDDGVATGVHLSLQPRTVRELPGVLRILARLSMADLLLSENLGEETPDPMDPAAVLRALEQVWRAANAAGVQLRCIGFERARYAEVPVGDPAAACDGALLETIRNGIALASARAGIRVLGPPDRPSGLNRLVRNADGLRDLGLELAARRCPIVDLPPCLGGTLLERSAASGEATFVKSADCPTCLLDQRCPGAPGRLDVPPFSPLESALRPLPAWYSLESPPSVLILSSLGGDPLYYKSTLPAVGDALRRRGANVEIVSPWLGRWRPDALPPLSEDETKPVWMGTGEVEEWLARHDLGRFDLVITSDFPTAGVALATGSLRASARIVVTDFHMLEAMDLTLARWVRPGARAAEGGWWPSRQLILESGFPGFLQLYLNYGVPLEQLAWRPYSLCPGHFPAGSDVQKGEVIFSGGNHLRDLETLRAATERLPAAVHAVDVYAPGERFAGNPHLRHRGQVDIASFCQAVADSRFMVLPVQEDPTRAAGITVLAMALRAGRPIVASSTAAIRDYVQHEVDALLVPPGDPEALAEAITRLDTDPQLLSKLAEGARRAGERMSTEHWAEQILSGTPLIARGTPSGWRNW